MNSRGSSSVDGIEPSVRERAEAAARRAGMSLNEWLRSTAGGSAPDHMAQSNQYSNEVADIHQRLDSITRQIDQLSINAFFTANEIALKFDENVFTVEEVD